jgi:hypothetical protein
MRIVQSTAIFTPRTVNNTELVCLHLHHSPYYRRLVHKARRGIVNTHSRTSHCRTMTTMTTITAPAAPAAPAAPTTRARHERLRRLCGEPKHQHARGVAQREVHQIRRERRCGRDYRFRSMHHPRHHPLPPILFDARDGRDMAPRLATLVPGVHVEAVAARLRHVPQVITREDQRICGVVEAQGGSNASERTNERTCCGS